MIQQSPEELKDEFEAGGAWGLATSVDVRGCDPEIIRDADKIRQFVEELCELIGMRRYGECRVVHFGEDEKVAGYSMVQLIETSLISGHFANASNTAYIDIFSCRYYNPDDAVDFTVKFFRGRDCRRNTVLRI